MINKVKNYRLQFPLNIGKLASLPPFLLSHWKIGKLVLAVSGGVVLLALILLINSSGLNTWFNPYSPGDVVYGSPIKATHDMNSGNIVQLSNTGAVNLSNPPRLNLSETFHDFGQINASQLISRTFVITNQGQSPLLIRNASTTCGCTTADFTASEIPPGKSVLMNLQFNPAYHDMRGATVRRGVIFETNDPQHPVGEVWIQATIR